MKWKTGRKSGAAMVAVWLWLCLGMTSVPQAGVLGPYEADANTLHLYHFDETAVPIVDHGVGVARDLDTAQGTFAVPAFPGFGGAFDVGAGNDPIPFAVNDIPADANADAWNNGHAAHSFIHSSSEYQGADGALTYEALIKVDSITGLEQDIMSKDGTAWRGLNFFILNGQLCLYNGYGSSGTCVPIPLSGDHAFDPNAWFHAAVTYTGQAGAADNLKFYWTRLGSAATAANGIGSRSFSADVLVNSQYLMIGNAARAPYRFELRGLIDEVRVSDVARSPDDFLFGGPVYTCAGFGPPMANYPVTVKGKRALPLKANLYDAAGYEMTDLELAAPPVVQVWFQSATGGDPIDVTDEALPPGQGDDGNQCFYDGDHWHFNLKTGSYTSPGTYTVTLQSGDDAEYLIDPPCETQFVIK